MPRDQDNMKAELELFAARALSFHRRNEGTAVMALADDSATLSAAFLHDNSLLDDEGDDGSVVGTTMAERMTSFDGIAAKETLMYVQAGIQELKPPFRCQSKSNMLLNASGANSDDDDENEKNNNL